MIDHYDAFISYKHAPLDNKVAAHVQSKLEHFHIPAKIRKKTGMKRIQRVFRDKDELPITSDLGATISHALENSNYLIVICSHNTRKSEWVRREIQYFLKYHSRRQILAVLAEGEPYEVLPEDLLREEVRVVRPDGTEAIVLHEKEPLCADFRQSMHKADKEELPRLASALIGCSYDELMNRRRAYQMQRITALSLAFVTLAFGVLLYQIWNRSRLQKSYRDTLRNQAIYLANESENFLEQEKRIDAIQMALAALPSEDNDRPVTSEAVRALTDATLAYKPLMGTNIEAVWNYKMPSMIEKMALSPERTSLAVSDQTGLLNVWDTEEHHLILEKSFSGKEILSIEYLKDDYLLVTTYYEVYMFRLSTQKQEWSFPIEDGQKLNTYYGLLRIESDESFFLLTNKDKIYHISTEDGELLDSYQLPSQIDNNFVIGNVYSISPDGKKIAVCMDYELSPHVGVYDFSDGSYKLCQIQGPVVRNLLWADAETIIVVGYDINSTNNLLRSDRIIVQPHADEVSCIDVSSMTLRWSRECCYNVALYYNELLNLSSRNAVAYSTGDVMEIYDLTSGDVLGSYQVQQLIADISDNDGDGIPTFVTESGALGTTVDSMNTNTTMYTFEFVKNIDNVLIGNGVYIHQKGASEIIYYDTFVMDDEWKEMNPDVVLSQPQNYFLDDDYLVLLSHNDNFPHITVYDAEKKTLIRDIDIEDAASSEGRILQIVDDLLYIAVINQDDGIFIYSISLKDDNREVVYEIQDPFFSRQLFCSMTGDFVTYISEDKETRQDRICLYNIRSGERESFSLPMTSFNSYGLPVYYPEQNAIIYNDEAGSFVINVDNKDVKQLRLPSNWSNTTFVEHDKDGKRWIIADMSRILVFDSEWNQEMELQTNGRTAVGAVFYKEGTSSEQILVAFNDGSFYRYDAENGNFIGKTEVEMYYNSLYDAKMTIDEEQGLLFIQTGFITDVVDTESWVELAVVWNSYGYHKPTDTFFASSYKGNYDYRIGYFRHYTLQELKDKAYRILKGSEMSEEQKMRYGIS